MISVTRTDVGKLRVNNQDALIVLEHLYGVCLLYTSPSPRDA